MWSGESVVLQLSRRLSRKTSRLAGAHAPCHEIIERHLPSIGEVRHPLFFWPVSGPYFLILSAGWGCYFLNLSAGWGFYFLYLVCRLGVPIISFLSCLPVGALFGKLVCFGNLVCRLGVLFSFKGTRALSTGGVSSVMESHHPQKLESGTMSKGHKEFYRTQKNIAAQVMASNKWTERCTLTDCVYIHFMTFHSKADECAQSMQ